MERVAAKLGLSRASVCVIVKKNNLKGVAA